VRIFDPDNVHDAYHVIRQVIEKRPGLAEWEAEVRPEFKPVPWWATVEAILAELGNPLEAPTSRALAKPVGAARRTPCLAVGGSAAFAP
jgi:hypothetical protein